MSKMNFSTIISVVEPKDKRYGLYRVTFKDENTGEIYFGDLTAEKYKRRVFEIRLREVYNFSEKDMKIFADICSDEYQEGSASACKGVEI